MTATDRDLQPLLDMLVLDLESRGDVWDEAPSLSFLYEMPDGWRISAIPLPDYVWRPNPSAGLEMMAAGMEFMASELRKMLELSGKFRPPEWQGAAFFSESWAVEQEIEPGEAADEVFQEMAKARMLSMHPARQEARCWWAMLKEGVFISVIVQRDGDVKASAMNLGEEMKFEGRIPDALGTIVKALAEA